MQRSVSIMKDLKGRKTVVFHDIKFWGKRKINWNAVEKYLKQYIGSVIETADYNDIIYIGDDFPDEYSGSKDTARLRGTLAKAKANATQGIPELVEIAVNKRFKANLCKKQRQNAKYGWYRYDSRFALPVYDENEIIERYNVFRVELLVRYSTDKKLYLYDVVNIKKKRAPRLSNNRCTVTNPFLL